jgi:hypothetical protein
MAAEMVNPRIFVIVWTVVLVIDRGWHVDAMRDCPSHGAEPLQIVPKDLGLFFPVRRRPNSVLNRRLPEITSHDVLSRRAVRGFLIRSTRR